MPNRHHSIDPRLSEIRAAVRRQMEQRGHTQKDLVAATGLSQSQISRFLAGQGKRLTGRIESLCEYAGIDAKSHDAHQAAQLQLSQALGHAIGNNIAAAQALTRIVQVLAPVLRHFPSEPPSRQEPLP